MAAKSSGWINDFFRFLATYSAVIYLAGLLVISIPVTLAWVFEIVVSPTTRYVIVGASLSVMVLAYIGERRARFPDTDKSLEQRKTDYSRRTRVLVAAAVLGLGLGIYAAIEINFFIAGIFFVGAYFFTRMAFKDSSASGK